MISFIKTNYIKGAETRPRSQTPGRHVRLVIEQNYAPVTTGGTVDQHKRHIRPGLLVDAAVLHLAVERIANLVVAIAVLDPLIDLGLDTCGRDKR